MFQRWWCAPVCALCVLSTVLAVVACAALPAVVCTGVIVTVVAAVVRTCSWHCFSCMCSLVPQREIAFPYAPLGPLSCIFRVTPCDFVLAHSALPTFLLSHRESAKVLNTARCARMVLELRLPESSLQQSYSFVPSMDRSREQCGALKR